MAVLACIVPAKAQSGYVGRGTGLDVSVLTLIGVRVVDTGLLPPTGGTLTANLATVNLTSGLTTVANTGVVTAQTIGGAGAVNSFAQVDGLRLFQGAIPALDLVRASVVRSDASRNLTSFGGSSTVTNLMVLGNSVTVMGAPNQVYGVPGVLNLTINRQTITNGVLRVDALHLDILDVARAGSISVASSYAGIVPEPSSVCLTGLAIPGVIGVFWRRRHSGIS